MFKIKKYLLAVIALSLFSCSYYPERYIECALSHTEILGTEHVYNHEVSIEQNYISCSLEISNIDNWAESYKTKVKKSNKLRKMALIKVVLGVFELFFGYVSIRISFDCLLGDSCTEKWGIIKRSLIFCGILSCHIVILILFV